MTLALLPSQSPQSQTGMHNPEPLRSLWHVFPPLTSGCRPVFAESTMLSRASRAFARGPLARQGELRHRHRVGKRGPSKLY